MIFFRFQLLKTLKRLKEENFKFEYLSNEKSTIGKIKIINDTGDTALQSFIKS